MSALVAAAAVGALSLSPFATRAAGAQPAQANQANQPNQVVYWQERFDHPPLDFVDPLNHSTALLQRVYSVVHEGDESFLHALHDETGAQLPAMHYGRAFPTNPPPLEKVTALKWRWRVLRHPGVKSDPWEDVAASVYVVMQTPTMFHGGRGFKFGWLAKPGPADTAQHGILQLPLRHDPAGPEWRSESADLCALYRAHFGACEGQHVLYVGVVTDADGSRSVSEADYAGFELVGAP